MTREPPLTPPTDTYPMLTGLVATVAGATVGGLVVVFQNPIMVIALVAALVALGAIVGRREFGLYLFVFIIYTRFSDVLVHSHGLPSVAQPLVALLFLLLLFEIVARREVPKGWRAVTVLLVSYGIVRGLSLFSAADFGGAFNILVDYFKDALIAVLVTLMLQRRDLFRGVIWALLGAGIFLGTLSSVQYLAGAFYQTFWGFSEVRYMNIIGSNHGFRAMGPIGDPNFYAQVMLPLVPLALDRFLLERQLLLRLLALWALWACVLAIVFTFSRGAFVAMALMLAVFVWYRPPRLSHIVCALLVGVLAVPFIPSQYTARVMTIFDIVPGIADNAEHKVVAEASFTGRASEFLVGLQMFSDYPLLGVGIGSYPAYYQSYSRTLGLDARREPRAPHNLYVEVGAETGLLGLLTFGAILAGMYWSMHRATKALVAAACNDEAAMVFALGVGIFGYLVAAVFLHAAYPRFLWLLFGIAMATPYMATYELTAQRRRAYGRS